MILYHIMMYHIINIILYHIHMYDYTHTRYVTIIYIYIYMQCVGVPNRKMHNDMRSLGHLRESASM